MKCVINRPDYYTGDQVVYLTATATSGDKSLAKDFKFLVRKAAMTEQQSVDADIQWLKENISLFVDKDIDAMKKNPLPFGSTVSWSSTNEDFLGTDGTVTRPDFGFPNEEASITASLTKGSASGTVSFDITIAAMTSEDELSIVSRKITWDLIRLENIDKSRVITPLNLLKSLDGVAISWSSTEPTVITSDGVVKRPPYDKQDVPVTLTATLTKESKSMSVIIDGLKVLKESPTAQQRCDMFVNDSETILNYITAKGTNANTAFQEIRESFVLPAEQEDMMFTWSLANAGGDAASPNSYISVAYQDGVSGVSDRRYTVTVSRPTGSDVSTYLKIVAAISQQTPTPEITIPGGSAEKLYAIKVLDKNTDTLSIQELSAAAFEECSGRATWSNEMHIIDTQDTTEQQETSNNLDE